MRICRNANPLAGASSIGAKLCFSKALCGCWHALKLRYHLADCGDVGEEAGPLRRATPVVKHDGMSVQCCVSDALLVHQRRNNCCDMLRLRTIRVAHALDNLRVDSLAAFGEIYTEAE